MILNYRYKKIAVRHKMPINAGYLYNWNQITKENKSGQRILAKDRIACHAVIQNWTRGWTSTSVDMDTSTACCDLDLWPPESNQVINRGCWIFPVSFIAIARADHEINKICSDERRNERTNERRTRRTDSPETQCLRHRRHCPVAKA